MINIEIQKQIIRKVEALLEINIRDVRVPAQGMDSVVLFAVDSEGKEYAIKYYTKGSASDASALRLLEDRKVDVPIPKVVGEFINENKTVLILEKINFPLLDTIPVSEMHRYIPSVVNIFKKVHQVKSDRAGFLNKSETSKNWKEILLAKFNDTDPALNWSQIVKRDGLDSELIFKAVKNIIRRIKEEKFIEREYSFLHTDFNQRNFFVDPKSDNITGIIDWGEAMFGDPVYDFARVRMFIWHFGLEDRVLEDYYKLVNFTSRQRKLEDLYLITRVIEYLAYYSEELNEFNIGRIKLHQDFLRGYKWVE